LSGEDGTEAGVQSNQEENAKDKVSDKYSGPKKASITEEKIGYLFGQATGRSHNINRAKQNARQMERLGVEDTTQGRQMIREHLEKVALEETNVKVTYSDQYGNYEVKESLFAGPSGEFAKFESTWEVTTNGNYRLTTVIPYGGKRK
jgi:hypothetical protein